MCVEDEFRVPPHGLLDRIASALPAADDQLATS